MVKIASIFAALVAVAPLLSLAAPFKGSLYRRDFTDIEASLEARGLEFTRRDIDMFLNYLEARTPTAPVAGGHSGTPGPAVAGGASTHPRAAVAGGAPTHPGAAVAGGASTHSVAHPGGGKISHPPRLESPQGRVPLR